MRMTRDTELQARAPHYVVDSNTNLKRPTCLCLLEPKEDMLSTYCLGFRLVTELYARRNFAF